MGGIKLFNVKRAEAGLTVVEVILSLAIIGMIVVVFVPIFTMSAKTNEKSKVTLEATYIGQKAMEEIYSLISKSSSYEELKGRLEAKGYDLISDEDKEVVYESKAKKYLTLKLKKEGGDLIRVLVRVYKDETKEQLKAQYESLYILGREGIFGEGQ